MPCESHMAARNTVIYNTELLQCTAIYAEKNTTSWIRLMDIEQKTYWSQNNTKNNRFLITELYIVCVNVAVTLCWWHQLSPDRRLRWAELVVTGLQNLWKRTWALQRYCECNRGNSEDASLGFCFWPRTELQNLISSVVICKSNVVLLTLFFSMHFIRTINHFKSSTIFTFITRIPKEGNHMTPIKK